MFTRRMTFGRILGFEIRADVTWLVIFALVLWSLAGGLFPAMYPGLPTPTAWVLAFAGTAGLFASLVAHELAHAVVARAHGLTIGGITLFLFGGVAELQSEPQTPRSEFLIAGAGPLASVVLAAGFYGLTLVMSMADVPRPVAGVVYYLALINLAIAVFNMLPAFPMDGGRLLRAAIWHVTGKVRRATKIASRLGQGFGLLLIAGGVAQFVVLQNVVGGLWWCLIGMFLHGNAGATYKRLLDRLQLQGLAVRDIMTRRAVTLAPETRLSDIAVATRARGHHDRYPVVDGERLLGWISARQIYGVGPDDPAELRVRDVMTPLTPEVTISAGAEAQTALDKLQLQRGGWLMVTEGARLAGVIALHDMRAYLQLRARLAGHTMPPTGTQ